MDPPAGLPGGRAVCHLLGPCRSTETSAGVAFSHDLSFTCAREYTARRAPIRELPRRRRRPNHGACSPDTMVSSQREISASSTAVALRSTPYT